MWLVQICGWTTVVSVTYFQRHAVYFMMHRPLKIRDTPPLYSIRIRSIRFNIRIWILEFAPWFGGIRNFTAILSFFCRFFVSYPLSSLNETQPKPDTCSEVSAIWKFMSEIWGIHYPYKSGAQNHLFSTTSQLNGNINGLYLRNKTWHTQKGKCVINYKRSPTSSENVTNFGPQTALNRVFTHPP